MGASYPGSGKDSWRATMGTPERLPGELQHEKQTG